MAARLIRGIAVRIVRPVSTRLADGSQARAGATGAERELFASEKVQFASLTTERKEHVFGASVRATETIRVPIEWGLTEGDQVKALEGDLTGRRFRVEKVIAYRTRPRISHAECALSEIPEGAL